MNKKQSQKKLPLKDDWHRADVVAALHKIGWTLRKLAKHRGYKSPSTLVHALNRPWPLGEQIIAEALSLHPQEIWPSRYGSDGLPNRGKRTNMTRRNKKGLENVM